MEPRKYVFIDKGLTQNYYHYALYCAKCKKNYYQPRSKEMYELVKGLQWIKSKRVKKSVELKLI